MPTVKDIAWIAGLLEGEGTFRCQDNGTNPSIKIGMKDKDVIKRVGEVLKYNGTITEYKLKSGSDFYAIQLYGNSAIQWMMTIYSLMGKRRREKIRSILTLWKHYEFQYTKICKYGHEMTVENVYIVPATGGRECKICKKQKALEQQGKRRNDPKYMEQHRQSEQKRRNAAKDPVAIIAKRKNISYEDAKKIFESHFGGVN